MATIRGQAEDQPQYASWLNPIDGSQMIWIAPGPFVLGPRDQPAQCSGFFLARHPVTNAQFQRFLDETGYRPSDYAPEPETFLAGWRAGRIPPKQEQHPVTWISLIDAVSYCRWAGLMLPDEWRWEKAARGPDGRPYPWGTWPPLGSYPKPYRLAHVNSAGTCPVGSFSRTRTAYGCEDMIGNVSEWCQPSSADGPGEVVLDPQSLDRLH